MATRKWGEKSKRDKLTGDLLWANLLLILTVDKLAGKGFESKLILTNERRAI